MDRRAAILEKVRTYYDSEKTINFYRDFWDPEHYHFGFYSLGMNLLSLREQTENMTIQMARRLGIGTLIPEDANIVDLGCGIGGSARAIAKHYPNVHITGVTLSKRQREVAAAATNAAGLNDRISFELGDYTNLGYQNGSFDGAYALESSCYAPDPQKKDFIEEASRILVPGGRLVVADGFRTDSKPLYPLLDQAYKHWCDGWAVPNLADIHQFTQAMKCSFQDISVEDVAWHVVPSMAYGVTKALGWAIKLSVQGKYELVSEYSREWSVGTSAAFLGANKNRFGYFAVSATR